MAQDELEDIFSGEIEVGGNDASTSRGQSGTSDSSGNEESEGDADGEEKEGEGQGEGEGEEKEGEGEKKEGEGEGEEKEGEGESESEGEGEEKEGEQEEKEEEKEGEEEEQQEAEGQDTFIECLSYTFIAELIPNAKTVSKPSFLLTLDWFFPQYVFDENSYVLLARFMNNIFKKDDKWYFTEDFLFENDWELIQNLDAKVLKYSILRLKNKPEYFKPDGYKYYFYDTIGNVLKSLIASNPEKAGIWTYYKGGALCYPISDNQIQLFDDKFQYGSIVTIKDDYLEITDDFLYLYGVKYLGKIKYEIDEIINEKGMPIEKTWRYGDQLISKTFEKMLGFVRILEQ